MPARSSTFSGVITRGLGAAGPFTQLGWVLEQCEAKLGFRPYPGTVNLRVPAVTRQALQERPAVTLDPPDERFCQASCWLLTIGGLPGAALIPHVAGYPADKLEIISPVAVLQTLGLKEGDQVEVRTEPPSARP